MEKNTRITIWQGTQWIATLAGKLDTDWHSHHAVQLCITRDEALTVEFPDRRLTANAVLIEAHQKHRVSLPDEPAWIALLQPIGSYAHGLRERWLKSHTAVTVDPAPTTSTTPSEWLPRWLQQQHQCDTPPQLSSRIKQTLQHIESDLARNWPIAVLAERIHWSPSRLQHQFKDQVGVALRPYIRWQRLIHGLRMILAGSPITTAALESGFSDARHFTRTCRRHFGVNPHWIATYSRFVQES